MRSAIVIVIVAFTFFLLLQPANATSNSSSGASHYLATLPGTIAVENSGLANNRTAIRIFTIVVGSSGFNGSTGSFSIQVSQGDNVTLKFVYGDDGLSFDNPHMVKIEGYNIETGKIDRETPVQEVTFTAGQVGSFQFHCVTPCFGMENLQEGNIVVKASSQETPIATNFSQMKIESRGDLLGISARLTDKDGAPVSGVIVNFSVSTDFGPLNLGRNVTGPDGTVQFLYLLSSPREVTVEAYFAGSGHYSESKATAAYTPPITQPSSVEVLVGPQLMNPSAWSSLATPYVSGQMPAIDLRLVGVQPIHTTIIVTVALLVVVSVWSVYVLVLKEIFAVRKAGKTKEGF